MPAHEKSNMGYRLNTANEDRFFLIENRQRIKWDKNLPGPGMLIFRVDSTNVEVWGSFWSTPIPTTTIMSCSVPTLTE